MSMLSYLLLFTQTIAPDTIVENWSIEVIKIVANLLTIAVEYFATPNTGLS
ncbi:MAG: hypothetical protein JJP05_08435 [cyanobacterium endosymbiont of Rhopalodia gibba]